MRKKTLLYCFAVLLLSAPLTAANYVREGNSVTVNVDRPSPNGATQLRLEVISNKIIRVQAAPNNIAAKKKSLIIVPQTATVPFNVVADKENIRIITKELTASVAKSDGRITFLRQSRESAAQGV
jgi:alpha-D-xyloside xylohydrolase